MSNTNDIVTSVLTGNLQEFKQGFSKLLAEKSVDFLGARSTEVSRGLVTECDCGCDADLEEVTKLHSDTHKIKKTKYGYQRGNKIAFRHTQDQKDKVWISIIHL